MSAGPNTDPNAGSSAGPSPAPAAPTPAASAVALLPASPAASAVPSHSAVARLQQATDLWWLAWTVGLTAWGWQSDTVSAAWGLLPLGLLGVVMVLEFGLAYGVNAAQGLAPWSWRGMLRALWGECRAAVAVFAWRQPWAWRDDPPVRAVTQPATSASASKALAPRGVLLVHGYLCNRGLWRHWHRALADQGHAVEAVNLEPIRGSIDRYAPTLDAAVARLTARTGQPPLVVGHSMGGLAVRAWLRTAAGNAARVAHVVTIGTPHHGTGLARWGQGTNVRQMRPGNPWLRELAAAESPRLYQRFSCWHSAGDNIVFPLGTAVLPGAQALALDHVGHVALADDPRVLAWVLRWLGDHAA